MNNESRFVRTSWSITCILLLSFTQSPAQRSGRVVTAYYPVWSIGSTPTGQPNPMYPHEMNWAGITHLIHFNVQPTQNPPYWDPPSSYTLGTPYSDSLEMFYGYGWRQNTSYNMIDSLKKYAHVNGVKLVLSLGGTWGSGAAAMDFITNDSSRTQEFVCTAIAFAARNGYDGIEVNWEPPGTVTQTDRLIRILKREMTTVLGPNAPLIVTVCPEGCQAGYSPSLQDSVQQYWITLYDMARPVYGIATPGTDHPSDVTGFNAPLHRPDSSMYPAIYQYGDNYDGIRQGVPNATGINSMLAMGFSANKLVVGIPFYGYVFSGRSAPNQPVGNVAQQYFSYVDALLSLERGGTRYYDSRAMVPWIGGTASQSIGWQVPAGGQFYITYDDTISIREKVAWAKRIPGIGGIGVYELSNGWVDSAPEGQKDPLLRALLNELDGNSSNPLGTEKPAQIHLSNNFPNPFNPSTTIRFELPVSAHVRLEIFNTLGQRVGTLHDGRMNPGVHNFTWTPQDLPSGVYFYRLEADDTFAFGRMVLLK